MRKTRRYLSTLSLSYVFLKMVPLIQVLRSEFELASFPNSHLQLSSNVLKIGSITESEKLSVHSSLVGPVVEPRSNR